MAPSRPQLILRRTPRIPRWATLGVMLYTAAAFVVVLVSVFERRGAWATFLAVWVLPIEEGLAWDHFLTTAQWGWAMFLSAHMLAVGLYVVVAGRAMRAAAEPDESASEDRAG